MPDSSMEWVKDAMQEIVKRHGAILDDNSREIIQQGNLPKLIFVDTNCCNGQAGGRNDANKLFYGMLKKLDPFHLINRIGREMNAEHPRKGSFLKMLSNCIFTRSKDDMDRLEAARRDGNVPTLNSAQQKADRTKFVRRVIADPPEIVSKMLLVVKGQIALDRKAKQQFEQSGQSCNDITTAHPAYPLMTYKVMKSVQQQCIHILNGCIDDESTMNVQTGVANYRDTGIYLPTFMSLRGSSKVEALHAVMDRVFYAVNNVRQLLFDARAHWSITNYNRARLEKLGLPALPPGVAPSESDASTINIVPHTDLRFGFDYCQHVLQDLEQSIHMSALEMVESAELDDVLDLQMDMSIDEFEDLSISWRRISMIQKEYQMLNNLLKRVLVMQLLAIH